MGQIEFAIATLITVIFVCYLGLCTVVVVITGSTAGLRDVAKAIAALGHVIRIRIDI